MMSAPSPAPLPPLRVESEGPIAHLRLTRADKRNAVNTELIQALDAAFTAPPPGTRVWVISGEGDHFCAGLDLTEARQRTPNETFEHSRMWNRTFEKIQLGGIPVVGALHGAVVGGGLELAAAMHVRVADETAFFALPEGQRGIFTGGGAAVRVARIIGTHRMIEMMLTGHRYDAREGLALGLTHYVVEPGGALAQARALAERIASNAQATNIAIVTALERIAAMPPDAGLFTESLVAALVESSGEGFARITDFLERRVR
jgi:enoyl-CoA hydratase/carnithine racemase